MQTFRLKRIFINCDLVLNAFLPVLPPLRDFHSSSISSRWYKHFLRLPKQAYVPPKVPVVWNDDCENVGYDPSDHNSVIPTFQTSPILAQLNDKARDLVTYKFASRKEELNLQVNAKLRELGYHPADNDTGATVIRMTMLIRYKKNLITEFPRNKAIVSSTRNLINLRRYQLNLLRSTNFPEFQRLSTALCITNFTHPDPFTEQPLSETALRKVKVRGECYQKRLSKMASWKVQLARSEQAFLAEKKDKLQQVLDDLGLLHSESENIASDSSDSLSHKLLKKLFAEVVEERQNEVLAAPRADELVWYAREEEARQRFQARQTEKQEKAMRRKRN